LPTARRGSVMLASDAVRAVTQGLVAVLLLSGEARIWQLLVVFAVFGAGDAFFSPASTGLVPETVSPGRLQQANALISLSRSASWVTGPALAGLIVAGAGPGWAFAIDAGTVVVSSVSLALLRPPRAVTEPGRERPRRPAQWLARGHRPHLGLDASSRGGRSLLAASPSRCGRSSRRCLPGPSRRRRSPLRQRSAPAG
jgi:MFS family permease